MIFRAFFYVCILLIISFSSCRKAENFLTDPNAQLSFSTDTVFFDTVFTTIGSATKRFKVFNTNAEPVLLSSISLKNGDNTYFRLNVDGIPGNVHKNVRIGGRDSIFIFIEATINPRNANNPMIIEDAVEFVLNGKNKDLPIVAWGQDAHFYRTVLFQNYILTNDKPHVFYGYSFVDSATFLIVEQGTKIHFHAKSGLIVYKEASLKIQGTKDFPVVIQGDRLEQSYKDVPGQWDRIWLYPTSKDNEIDYAIIRNGNIGIHVDTVGSANPTLTIRNSIIENMSGLALLAQGATIRASNCVFANCGQYTAALVIGGDYEFIHCSFANYWSYGNRSTPQLYISNYYKDANNVVQVRPFNKLYFGNSIIAGSKEDELEIDEASGTSINYMFDHCLLVTKLETNTPKFINIVKNPPQLSIDGIFQNGIFKNVAESDYRLIKDSYAKDKGDVNITGVFTLDIAGRTRDSKPDLGAYEYDPN